MSGDSGYEYEFDQVASDDADLRHAQWMAGRGDTSLLEKIQASAPAVDPITNPTALTTTAAPTAPLTPTAPAYTPFNLDQYGYNTDKETEYYNAAKLANWQMSQGRPEMAQQYIERANALKTQLDSPYRIDTISSGGGGDAGQGSVETMIVGKDGNTIRNLQVGEDGTFNSVLSMGGDSGSDYGGGSFKLEDIIKQSESEKNIAFGTGRGQAVGYAYELKNEDGEPYQRYDANGNLTEFLNRITGEWTKASDVKPIGTVFDPVQGKMVTQYQYGDNKFTSELGSAGSTYAPMMDPYSKDTGGFMGEGGWAKAGALVAAGLTAGLASGALVPASMVGAAPGSAAAIGLTAAKGALTGIAVSGIQGATPAEMLKAGLLGGVGAGLGSFVGAADLGTVGNIAAKAGIQTGLTAIAGGNIQNALISSLINSTLPVVLNEALPADTASIIADLPKPIQTLIMSTAGSVLNAGFNGQDISSAAVNGVTNGIISLGKDFAKGAFNNLSESELAQTVRNYLNPSYEEFQEIPYDADAALDNVIRNLPTQPSASGTTASVSNPYSVENIMANLEAGYQNAPSTTGLPQYAEATTRDVINPLSYGGDRYGAADTESPGGGELSLQEDEPPATAALKNAYRQDEETLQAYNAVRAENGLPPSTIDDADFLNAINRLNDRLFAQQNISNSTADTTPRTETYNPNAPLESPFQPRLPASEYDPAIKALEDAGLEVSYKTLDQFTQDPGALVDKVYPVLAGRQPTEQERIDFIDQYSNSATASPQDLIKNIYDKVQLDKQLTVYLDQSTSTAPPTPVPPLTAIADPEKVDPDKAPKVNAPKGGSGTQGGSLAGDQGRVGEASALASSIDSSVEEQKSQAILSEAKSLVSLAAESGLIDPADIPTVTFNLTKSSNILGISPSEAIQRELVQDDGRLSDKGVDVVAKATGLTATEVITFERGLNTSKVTDDAQGSSTIEQGSGSSLKGEGAGGAKGTGTGISGDQGLGGSFGSNIGGTGTGVGTGVGSGEGSGTGKLPSLPSSSGRSMLLLDGLNPGALPGSLEGTYLKGADVESYDPFENYNVYQQIAPVRAAQGGSPLQLAQLQQGIYGVDPRQYSVIQNRPAPSYFTYGTDTSQNAPAVFAGSQLMSKPRPSIPVTPTGNIGANDWMYGSAGSNQLSPAGAAIPALPSGMMANGGMAHGGMDEDEHVPEFITGLTGHYVKGRGDGQSDDIPAMLADGEYVFDAETVAQLGNGSSDAGAEVLDKMRESIRRHKRSAPIDEIPPKSKSPLEYLAEATKGKRT